MARWVSRLGLTYGGIAVLVALATGCSPMASAPASLPTGAAATPSASLGPTPDDLSFSYHRYGPQDETINQTLDIKNDFAGSVVPVLSFTALDAHGAVLPQVAVSTVYGSNKGTLVVPYGYGLDILRFSGPGAHRVADVRVSVRSVTASRIRGGLHYANAQALNAQGGAVSKFSRFSAVRVTNSDSFPVSVRIVYLVYDQPASGQTQQAVVVVPIGGLVAIPAKGKATIKVTGAAAQAVARYSNGPAVSIKTYPSQ